MRLNKLILLGFCMIIIDSCKLNYLDYIQHIESPDGKYNYCLFSDDVGISDPGFMVLKIEKTINPKTLEIDWSFKNGISKENAEWIDSRAILSNYDEASYYCKNPKLELIDKRFLVFSRGGYYFGLYDLKLQKDTFNNCCPFGDWASKNIWAEKGTNYKGKIDKNEKSDYGIWIEKNIHNKIKEYIEKNKD